MSPSEILRALVTQRLAAAAEDICALFDRTVAQYEQQVALLERAQSEPVRSHAELTGVQTVTVAKETEGSACVKEEPLQEPPVTPVLLKTEAHEDREDEEDEEESELQQENRAEPDATEGGASRSSGRRGNVKCHSCPECAKSFGRPSDLERHMTVHSGLRPYSCSVCQKSFGQRINLKRHMKTHSTEPEAPRERKYSCARCGKSFTRNSELNRHNRIHTGHRPFSCPVCDKRFFQRSHLKQHLATHTEREPFSCPFCGRSFTQRVGLQRHIRGHTEEQLQGGEQLQGEMETLDGADE